MKQKKGSNKKNCLVCAFCTKVFRNPDSGEENIFFIKSINREGDFSDISDVYYLHCYFDQWDEARGSAPKRDNLNSYRCRYFLHYEKASFQSFPALKQSLIEKKERKRFIWTVIGAIAAIIAASPVIFTLIKKIL